MESSAHGLLALRTASRTRQDYCRSRRCSGRLKKVCSLGTSGDDSGREVVELGPNIAHYDWGVMALQAVEKS